MESNIQSSFIPHDAGTPQKQGRSASSGGLGDLLLVLGIVALAASAALAGAVFLYQQYLQSQSTSDLASLQRAEQEFQPSLIDQLTRLSDRMAAAQTILAAHLAPSAFFSVLNQVTLQTISYTSLDLDASDPTQIQVKMQGVAQSVNSIALQSDLLSQSSVFTSPIFSNIDREADGVHFDLSALVNPAAINFSQLASGSSAASQVELPTATPAPGTSTTTPSTGSTGSPQTGTGQASTTSPQQ